MEKSKLKILGNVVGKSDTKKFVFVTRETVISVGQGVAVENGHSVIIGIVENIENVPLDKDKSKQSTLGLAREFEEYVKRRTTNVCHCRIAMRLKGRDVIDNCKSPPIIGSQVLKIERVEGLVFQTKNEDKS
jgi:hypothetical protein